MKRKIIVIILTVVMLFLAVGCASNSTEFSEDVMMAVGKPEVAPEPDMEYMEDRSASNNKSIQESFVNTTTTMGNSNQEKKVVKNGSVTMEVTNYTEAMNSLEGLIGTNGYIERSDIWKTPRYVNDEKIMLTNANLSVRVPKERFESFIKELENIGLVINQSTNSDDISYAYYDTQARVQLKLDEKVRLEQYLNEIDDAKIYFEVQSRITEVIFEIEQLKGNVMRWDNQVAYSRVNITINEIAPDEDPTITKPKGFFGKIWDNIVIGVEAIGTAIIFFSGAIPALILIALIVFIVVVLARKKKSK